MSKYILSNLLLCLDLANRHPTTKAKLKKLLSCLKVSCGVMSSNESTHTFDEWLHNPLNAAAKNIVTEIYKLKKGKQFIDYYQEKIVFTIYYDKILKNRNIYTFIIFNLLVGSFHCKSEYPWCIIIEVKSKNFPTVLKENREKQKKSVGKTGIFTQNQFSTKLIFLYMVVKKFNTKFSISFPSSR
ncbi:hypothetical protein AGLY_001667 [Aphis glycines]|uniref:Uncharacterized protein n=1 Tax=Aphis glycines TaxID=307491 RepID=A0A6G0U4D3_APHGL|nr:hypothetical protein AGLY_001667 [Aphis glycines]